MNIEKIRDDFGYKGKLKQWQEGFDALLKYMADYQRELNRGISELDDDLQAPPGARRFDCAGEIEMIDAEENTIRVKPLIRVAGLKAGDHCNLILYKYLNGLSGHVDLTDER